jgi:hypothetical protein
MKKIIYCFCIIVFLSCKSKNNHNNEVFKSIIDIKSTSLIKSLRLQDPWDISILDTLILVGNRKGEPLLEIYDLHGKLLKKCLKIGKGPSEVLLIATMQIEEKNNLLYIYDLFAKKILKLSIDKVMNDSLYKPELLMNFRDSLANIDKIIISKNFYVGENRSPGGRLALIDFNGKIQNIFVKFPEKVDPMLDDYANATIYSSEMALSPNNNYLALSTFCAGMLDFFKVSSTSIVPIWNYQEFLPEKLKIMQFENLKQAAFTKDSRNGYCDIAASNKYVYTIFSGKKFSEPNYSFGKIIRIISWDGKKTFELHLDKNINRLAVSKDEKKIYAIAVDDENEPEIVFFDISGIKH